jgi:hypothetical protein
MWEPQPYGDSIRNERETDILTLVVSELIVADLELGGL